MSKIYIAYGSNLNVPQMMTRCPRASILGTAELNGWELLFRGSMTGSYLTIEQATDGKVPVALWKITDSDECALDRYEGFPRFYYKREFKVRCGKRTVTAFAYIMYEDRPYGVPTSFYLRTCAQGYDTFRFDKAVLWTAYEKSKELSYNENR